MKEIVGRTITRIDVDDDSYYIECNDGYCFSAYHMQSCCENVRIYDILGDPQSIVGAPILYAHETIGDEPGDINYTCYYSSHTWTYHTYMTENGFVTFRWLGESNGWYSENVHFGFSQRRF